VDRTVAAYEQAVAGARERSEIVDHVWRSKTRFTDVLGSRLAAAISYYGFFAAFSLALLLYSILGRLPPTERGAVANINEYLEENLPWIRSASLEASAGTVTAIGAVALVLTGIGWVEALRSSQRYIWQLDQHPGNWIIRRLVDLGMLVGLGLLLTLSLAMTTAIDKLLDWLAGPETTIVGDTILRSSGPVLEFAVNLILAAALLAAVPRLRLGPRRLVPAALVVAVGVQLLNSLGRLLIARTENNPAYQVVAGSVGLLVYLFLFNQLILYGAAIAATANRGTMVDLAAGPPPAEENKRGPMAAEPAHTVGEPRGNPRSNPP
jgi:membrane protein